MEKKFIGGLRAGETFSRALNYTWPLISLSLKQDHVEIVYRFFPKKKHILAYADIQSIGPERHLFTGLRIIHKTPDTPVYLLFWSGKIKEICDIFARYGVQVIQQ